MKMNNTLDLIDQCPQNPTQIRAWFDTLSFAQFETVWLSVVTERLLDGSLANQLWLLAYVRERYRGKHKSVPKTLPLRYGQDVNDKEVLRLRDDGLTWGQIAERLGCSIWPIRDRLRKFNRKAKGVHN